ncbi:hypothetical protein WA026_017695 [Henosepilachna vigintioctopunctata]|uniref:Uncharacterized protein n=1 Tax=Henosepilachna vigintioctopunctata TaxID=420089 RepID=A0AAW1U899_9CUCU
MAQHLRRWHPDAVDKRRLAEVFSPRRATRRPIWSEDEEVLLAELEVLYQNDPFIARRMEPHFCNETAKQIIDKRRNLELKVCAVSGESELEDDDEVEIPHPKKAQWVIQIHDTIAHTEVGEIQEHARSIVQNLRGSLQYADDMCGQIYQDVVNAIYQRVMDFIRGVNRNQATGRRRSRSRNSQQHDKRSGTPKAGNATQRGDAVTLRNLWGSGVEVEVDIHANLEQEEDTPPPSVSVNAILAGKD